MHPPRPNFSITIDRDGGDEALSALPRRPGVFAFEDDSGRTLCLAVTANLRRLVRSRLQPVDPQSGPSRQIEYGRLTRRVCALPVGSSFEADWACLQLARERVPTLVGAMTDRWPGWWVHINARAEFPRFTRTAHPGSAPTGTAGIFLGPIADKHAAARFIETLQAGFDLCRYHHILIESPNGRACAYKEIGRCPAPCDGTVSMTHYHQQINEAIAFAADRQRALGQFEREMQSHSRAVNIESAERLRRRIDDLAPAMKPAFRHVDRMDRFRWIAALPGERADTVRVFVIAGGWIAPLADVHVDAPDRAWAELADAATECLNLHPVAMDEASVQNIGLVCASLFRPKRAKHKPAVFARCPDRCTSAELRAASRQLHRQLQRQPRASESADASSDVADQIVDAL